MYQTHTISAVTSIPALVGSFANAVGFTTDLTTPSQPLIRNPTGGVQWRVRASAVSLTHEVIIEGADGDWSNSLAEITSDARTQSPIRRATTGGVDTVRLPVRLHLIGALTPQPYIGIVIEYSGPEFRHLYLGNMERMGAYTGGELIAGTDGPLQSDETAIRYDSTLHMKQLFQSRTTRRLAANSGGVRVEHVDNPIPWRRFFGAIDASPMSGLPEDAVIGGFGDDANDGFVARARALFAGLSLLVPINLYAVKKEGTFTTFVPLGHAAGVRLVNMADLTPGQEIVVGGYLWRVYPSHARRTEKTMPKISVTGVQYRQYESSHLVGYAYAVGEEDSNS